MRSQLAKRDGVRGTFRATFVRLGKKLNYRGQSEETLLLTAVSSVDENRVVCDHVWFAFTKGFQEAKLTPGCLVEFDARIKEYTKGYVNKRIGINQKQRDYKLSHPTKVKVVDIPGRPLP